MTTKTENIEEPVIKEEPVILTYLEAENFKKIKAISCHLDKGLNIIGGGNRNGKTSFMDFVAWTLGGERFRPTEPDNSETGGKARTRIEMSNGMIAERKGKNGTLTVTDPTGVKGGQAIADEVIEKFALDLPKFQLASNKEKAKILLDILGVEDELQKLEEAEKALYAERELMGKQVKQAKGYAEQLDFYEEAPAEPVSAQQLIKKQQAVLLKNAENEKARNEVGSIKRELERLSKNIADGKARIADKEKRIAELQAEIAHEREVISQHEAKNRTFSTKLEAATKSTAQLKDESTAELETQLQQIEEVNAQVRANQEKAKARDKAESLEKEYASMSIQIGDIRNEIKSLLEGAKLPLPELIISGGELEYRGQKWDCMSGAEQLMVSTAIVRQLNPRCGFVLVDKLEQMDLETLREFGTWAQEQGLQVLGTRVSKGSECTFILEDGNILETDTEEPEADYEICLIPGRFQDKRWADIPVEVRKYALENLDELRDHVTAKHVAAIKKSLK